MLFLLREFFVGVMIDVDFTLFIKEFLGILVGSEKFSFELVGLLFLDILKLVVAYGYIVIFL